MPREDVSFQTSDGVTLRGWFYTPEAASTTPLPVVILSHGFTAVKEMFLDEYAKKFISYLPINVLVYDHRGFGASETLPHSPRQEIIVALQASDLSDAITYAQARADVNKEKIAIWGVALSGGHVLKVGAADRRVKAVLSQVPMLNGWENFNRLTLPFNVAGLNDLFEQDRLARAAGKPAITIPVSDITPGATSALQGIEAHEFFEILGKGTPWKNKVTIKTMQEFRSYNPWTEIHHIAPTPLLMTVATKDTLMPTDLALAAYEKALEPKELQLISGPHFGGYGEHFEAVAKRQADFLKKTLY